MALGGGPRLKGKTLHTYSMGQKINFDQILIMKVIKDICNKAATIMKVVSYKVSSHS